jgi:hypothetical protein
MGFKRQQAAQVQAIDLGTLTAAEVERKIIDGVRKYATREANWKGADANTPFLGHIIGMGIESSNLADITMSIERQFLSKRTKRVTLPDGTARLDEGELGPLRILSGQDATAATPGLAVRMLMEHGHMKTDEAYLKGVVSFGYIIAVGDGYRLNDSLQKALSKGAEAAANVKTLAEQARAYAALLADAEALARARQEAFEKEKAQIEELRKELDAANRGLKELETNPNEQALVPLRSKQAELNTRHKAAAARLRVSEEVARGVAKRGPAEQERIEKVRQALLDSAEKAGSGKAEQLA